MRTVTETVSTGVAADAAKLAGRQRVTEKAGGAEPEGAEDGFPGLRTCPFAAPAQYGRIREEGIAQVPLWNTGQKVWWVSRHEDARAVLNDRRFSSDRRKDNFPIFNDDESTRERFRSQPPSMIGLDGAEHAKARRAVVGEFTVKRIAAMQPRIQQIVDEQIDKMLASERPVDLVQMLSLAVPSIVICEMLGVPYEDHDFFQTRSSALIRRSSDSAERTTAFDELRGYLDKLITAKEAEPGDDLFSRQIARQGEEGGVDHESLVSMAFLLLLAGHETTGNMISLGTIGFLENPEQLAAIKADPSKTPLAVEEMLRYFSIADTVTRVATEDVLIDGVTVKAGEGVIASTMSANWDSDTFADADKLDIDRGARHHVAFGYGPHQCLGQNLARQELEIVYETLFRRVPTLRLAASLDEIPFKNDGVVYGTYQLPVTW